MNRVNILEEMVKFKDIRNDEDFERFYEAWENLSEDFYLNKTTLSKSEAELLMRSFSDKREHPYLKDMLVDAIVIYVKNTGDVSTFMQEMLKNKEGFYESLWALNYLLAFYPEFKEEIRKHLVIVDKETKEDMLGIYKEYPSYTLEKDLMEILCK